MMRRLVAGLVVMAVCGTVFSLGVMLSRPCGKQQGLMGAMLAQPAALAQEVMQFKAVPPESLNQVERPRRRSSAPPAAPVAPVPPTPPTPGVPPPMPDVGADHSGDVVRFGSDIVIREGQVVTGDVVAMGGDVTIDGHVEKDVVAMGGDVFLGSTGRVDGQVVTLGGKLHEKPGSQVGGQRVTAEGLPRGWFRGPFFGFMGVVNSGVKAIWSLTKMMMLILIAWGITQLAPNRTRTAIDAFKSEPVKSLGFGLLAWALIIPSVVALALVVAILCITIIGIPLALAVILGYVLAIMLLCIWGYVVGAAVLGERLARQFGRPAATLTLMAVWGIVSLTVIRVIGQLFGAIPMGGFAGGMLVFLATVIAGVLTTVGAGALLWTQLRRDAISQWWPGMRNRTPAPAPASPAPGPAPSPMTAPEPPPAPPSLGV